MRRVVLQKPGEVLFFPDVEAPKAEDLKGNEILLDIMHIGICGSEIHSYHGTHPSTMYPVVQGHEYSGIEVTTMIFTSGNCSLIDSAASSPL